MTPETFLKEFGAIANAPGGVQRLREMILQLAVMGKIVEQNAEESVDDLVTVCAESKKKYIEKLKLRKVKPVKNVSEKNFPFQIPKNWKWIPLDHICDYIQRGKGPKYDDSSDVKVVSQKCVRWEGFDISQARGLDLEVFEKYNEERFLIDGDLLWNSTGTGTAGRACIYRNTKSKAVADSHVTVVRAPQINGNFIWCYIASPMIQARFNPNHPQKIVSGTTNQVELSTTNVKELPIPLPPLSEQHRITAKVDQLMALCDHLEAQQQERATLLKQSRISALNELSNAQGAEALQIAWKRLQDHLSILFDHPDDVEDLKSAIRNLAILGNLTKLPKTPKSTGKQLLSEIEQARSEWQRSASEQELKEAQLVTRKIKKQKVDYPTTVALPKHWEWASFLQISQAVIDCHNKTAPYVDSGIHLVRTTDIRDGKMNLKNTKKITKETYDFWARRMHPTSGDIFFTREAPMGEAAIVPDGKTVCLGQRTMLIRLFPELFNRNFLLEVIYSPSFIQRMKKSAIGATVKHLRVGDVENLMVPVPPMEEQTRIVQKTQSLLALCNHLQNQLKKSQTIAEQLAKSIVETITGQSTEEQERMKRPKTELVSKLKLVKKPGAKVHAPLSAILVKNNDELSAKALWNTSGLAIDDFYRQLKTEMVNGWIAEPVKAHVRITDDQGKAQ